VENGGEIHFGPAIGSFRTQNTTMKMPHRTCSKHMARTATENATLKNVFESVGGNSVVWKPLHLTVPSADFPIGQLFNVCARLFKKVV